MLEKGEASFNERFYAYKYRCKRNKTTFSLTGEEFRYICEQDCCYCGQVPTPITNINHLRMFGQWSCNTLDRISSKLGYVRGNIVPCCERCNRMKSDMDVAEFLSHVKSIQSHLETEPRKD